MSMPRDAAPNGTTESMLPSLVSAGDEHIARSRYGDRPVDRYLSAEGWDVEAVRGGGLLVVDFRYAVFDDVADFRHARFLGGADFRHAQFKRGADFRGAQFGARNPRA